MMYVRLIRRRRLFSVCLSRFHDAVLLIMNFFLGLCFPLLFTTFLFILVRSSLHYIVPLRIPLLYSSLVMASSLGYELRKK